MKKLRVFTVVAAVCVLALALVGCGGGATSSSSAGGASASAATSASAQGEAVVRIDTEGMGTISWAYEDEEVEFDDTPYQSAFVSDAYGQTIHVEARDFDEYEGWHFTKWTKDGNDYSTDNRIDVLVDSDTELVAVFEFEEE